MLASVDGNGDGVMGVPMAVGGPLTGFNANFNASLAAVPLPVPAAVWLFGSGLLGLVGVAHRRKKTAWMAGSISGKARYPTGARWRKSV